MEKETNTIKKSDTKAKVVGSTSNPYSNIQPRVLLEKLGKDFTFGVTPNTDNQPSTSSYVNQEQAEVDSNVSVKAGESNLNIGKKDRMASPSTKTKNSTTNGQDTGLIEFKVAELKDVNTYGSNDETESDCSFHSTPGESVVFDENNSGAADNDGREKSRENNFEINTLEENKGVQENNIIKEDNIMEVNNIIQEYKSVRHNNRIREYNAREIYNRPMFMRNQYKIEKAINILTPLIDPTEQNPNGTAAASQSSSSGRSQTIPCIVSRIKAKLPVNTLRDCMVRLWLPVCGQKKKKKFHVKLSQLLFLLNQKNHPLHKFHNTLAIRNLKYLTESEITTVARVLSEFVCAKPIDL